MPVISRRGSLGVLAIAGFAIWRNGGDEPVSASPDQFHFPDTPDTHVWRVLATMSPPDPLNGVVIPAAVAALDGQEARLIGFMLALGDGPTHRRFLLSANPPGCPGCRVGAPGTLIAARWETPSPARPGPLTVIGEIRIRANAAHPIQIDRVRLGQS